MVKISTGYAMHKNNRLAGGAVLQTAESRSQKPESRMVTGCLKSEPQATPQRHAV